jgi:hypothetical protein
MGYLVVAKPLFFLFDRHNQGSNIVTRLFIVLHVAAYDHRTVSSSWWDANKNHVRKPKLQYGMMS